jgi:hypothetical protein
MGLRGRSERINMNVKEQLAMYRKALAAEEANRSEILAQFDTRIANLQSLISGLSNPAISAQGGSGTEATLKRKGKAPTAIVSTKAAKKTTKKTAKPVKVYTRATAVAKGGKKNPDVPRLEDAMQIVMGGKELSAPEIHAEIRARHWIPASKDPLGYIRYALSANRAIFLRREGVRGRYHLDPKTNPYASGKHKFPIEGYVNPKTKKKAEQVEDLAEVEGVVEPPSMDNVEVVSTAATAVMREDPKSVVDELLRDGGESAFGRQAPIAARTE